MKANLPYYIYRTANVCYKLKIPVIPFLIQQLLRFGFCCYIPYQTKIGNNVHFGHNGLGIVLGKNCIIGDNCRIFQNVTIGGREGEMGSKMPIVGYNVLVGAGAIILGDIKIGNNVEIGANAVVLDDIPDNSKAFGVSARVINE